MTKSTQNKIKKEVGVSLLFIIAPILLIAGGLSFWAHVYVSGMVRSELAAQKIYFPPKGSPALTANEFPDLQQYAGQQVDSPEKAKAYANGFIGRHLKKVANGKVYAEVSTAAMKDPSNTTLQQQKQTLFQGETLRAMLLTSGYGFGMMGRVAGLVAYTAAILGVASLLLAVMLKLQV